MTSDLDLRAKAKKIKLIAFDVDGVMTDGSLTYLPNGEQVKTFNAKDGQGIVMLNKAGFLTAIITAKESSVVLKRAETLKITKVFTGQSNKLLALNSLVEEFNIDKSEVAYMGDDYPDLCVINEVGLSSCPNDAIDAVKLKAKFVSSKNGGKGAVRELCDLILDAYNIKFEDLI